MSEATQSRPSRTDARTYLEVATNLAVLLCCAAVIVVIVRSQWSHDKNVELRQGLHKGTSLPGWQRIIQGESPWTLVMAMSVGCQFCSDSIDFYNRLASVVKETNPHVKLVAIFPERRETVLKYVQENRLDIDFTSEVDLLMLGISGTPTLILVNNSGQILDFWTGKLSPNVQEQMLQSLAKTGR